jgi:glycosyltransferase involved in cell wall biosynthesis
VTDGRPRVVVLDAYAQTLGGSIRVGEAVAQAVDDGGGFARIVLTVDGPVAARVRSGGRRVVIVPTPRALSSFGGASTGGVGAVLAALSLPFYWTRLWREFEGTDVLWANDLRGLILGLVPARLRRARVVWHVHNASTQAPWVSRAAAAADVVVVPSRSLADQVGLPHAVVVPNPLLEVADAGEELLADVVTLARLHPMKGVDLAVDAGLILAQRGRAIRWVVAGGPSDGYDTWVAELRAKVDAAGGPVELIGDLAAPGRVLRSRPIYVQPSREEPFGLATLEAMAAGCAVVVTPVPALVALVGDAGVVAADISAAALADAVASLLDDEVLRRSLGDRARALAVERYSYAAFREHVRAILRS